MEQLTAEKETKEATEEKVEAEEEVCLGDYLNELK